MEVDMKTPKEWLAINYDKFQELYPDTCKLIDLIRRIQQDAQPKWVSGEIAKTWPDFAIAIVKDENFANIRSVEDIKNFKNTEGLKFLNLDGIL
jgi:hypothetical protein